MTFGDGGNFEIRDGIDAYPGKDDVRVRIRRQERMGIEDSLIGSLGSSSIYSRHLAFLFLVPYG